VAWRVDRIGFSKDCKNRKRENKESMRRKIWGEERHFWKQYLIQHSFSKFANIKVLVLK
jgi:hypothetical protein